MDEPESVLDTGNVLLHPSRTARLLLFVALPVYLLAFTVLRPDRDPEMWEPGAIAERLRAGDGYALIGAGGTAEATANQEPVYPLLLALLGKWMLVIQVILWLSVARLLAWLAHRLVGAPEAWTAIAVALLAAARRLRAALSPAHFALVLSGARVERRFLLSTKTIGKARGRFRLGLGNGRAHAGDVLRAARVAAPVGHGAALSPRCACFGRGGPRRRTLDRAKPARAGCVGAGHDDVGADGALRQSSRRFGCPR